MRLLIVAATFTLFAPASGWAQGRAENQISILLKEKTQAFSDAGQAGDGAALARMLDDRVVFVNEGGDMASKADMAKSVPGPSSVKTVMTIEDWHCEVHGAVAVATFIDDQKQDFYGQPFHARYRSVETWLDERGQWRMIGSQTLALVADPKPLRLEPTILDGYVGTYEAAPGVQAVLSRSGTDLLISAPGVPPTVQKASSPDVLFTPGRPRGTKVFERDASGKVIGFNLRREGHDIFYRRVSTGAADTGHP